MRIRVHHHRRQHTGGLWLFSIVAASIWAYQASPLAGVATTIIVAAIVAYAARRAWRAL